MQDWEIIKRIRQGEKQLFEQLALKYYDEVFRYCWYCTGDENAAYDCTQETFLRLMRFPDNYTEKNRFKPYLLRIALNICRDYFRQRNRTNISYEELTEEHIHPILPYRAKSEDSVLNGMQVQAALMKLSEVHREAVILYFYYGYKQREIARITGVPLSTVKTRLRAATERLRNIFAQEGEFYEHKP